MYIRKIACNSGLRRGIRGEQSPNFSASLVKWCDMIYKARERKKTSSPAGIAGQCEETPEERLSGRKDWAQGGRSGSFLDVIFLNYLQHHLMELTDHTITLPTAGRSCVTHT